jgi:hypothetical protein
MIIQRQKRSVLQKKKDANKIKRIVGETMNIREHTNQ